jgi:hypothetical protein
MGLRPLNRRVCLCHDQSTLLEHRKKTAQPSAPAWNYTSLHHRTSHEHLGPPNQARVAQPADASQHTLSSNEALPGWRGLKCLAEVLDRHRSARWSDTRLLVARGEATLPGRRAEKRRAWDQRRARLRPVTREDARRPLTSRGPAGSIIHRSTPQRPPRRLFTAPTCRSSREARPP